MCETVLDLFGIALGALGVQIIKPHIQGRGAKKHTQPAGQMIGIGLRARYEVLPKISLYLERGFDSDKGRCIVCECVSAVNEREIICRCVCVCTHCE